MRLQACLTWTMTLAIFSPIFMGQQARVPDLRQAALVLEQQGKTLEAEAAWRSYLKTHPSNAEPYAHLGLLEARQEHYKEAVPLYRKALALKSGIPGLRMNLALALFKGGELKLAIVEFKALLKDLPPASAERQRLIILLGMAHYGLGEYAEAAPYLKQATDGDAQNLPLRLALAHSCLWSKQYQCVLDAYHEILMLNAESAEAFMLAGEALDAMKDQNGAIEQFRAAVKADPKAPEAHFGLGYLLWTQRQFAEAASEFRAELENNPNYALAMTYLGDTEMQLNHPEAALPLLEKALKIGPSQEMPHLDLGIIYADAGRNDDALKELKEAARLAPQDVNVHWRLGRLYRSMGRKDEAKVEFDKASSITKSVDSALVDKISGDHSKGGSAQPQEAAPQK